MNRILKYFAIAFIVLTLAFAAIFAAIIIPLQSAPALQTSNGMHFVSDGRSTIAIVPTGSNQILLVDSGMDEKAAKVRAELSRLGMTPDSVNAILFTHGHPDHIGGAKQFLRAERMALRSDVNLIDGLSRSKGPVTRLFPVSPTGLKVDRVLQDGESFSVGKTTVQVFALPGHTMGSAAYLINGVLFLGDSANATTSGKLQSATWLFSDDLQLNEVSLRSLATRLRGDAGAVQTIAFGHSGLLKQGLKPLTDWADSHPM